MSLSCFRTISRAILPVGTLCVTAASLLLPQVSLAQRLAPTSWALSGGGVWDIPGARRIVFNPANGSIGNMGAAGVVYGVAAPPAGAQAGAAAGVINGFTAWNALAAVPFTRINLVGGAVAGAKLPARWGALAARTLGSTNNAAVNFNPRTITLNNTSVLRGDGWNIFAPPAPIIPIEIDTYTINVHEAGHGIGLGHPRNQSQIMSATVPRGDWVRQLTPFAGQPTTIAGGAFPNGWSTYNNPNANFGHGDLIGGISLYNAPIAIIGGVVARVAGALNNLFTYNVTNTSAGNPSTDYRTGYCLWQVRIPVPSSITVSNMTASSGWNITREQNDVLVENDNGLLPSQSISFSFQAPASANTGKDLPNVHWALEGLDTIGDTTPGFDNDLPASPAFDPMDFTVLDGTYNYSYDSTTDQWVMMPFPTVPVPGPGVNYPVPTLTSISPSQTPIGSPDTTVTLTGTNFVPNSTAIWVSGSQTALATNYVSSTQLTAVIPASALSADGTFAIFVNNPGVAGGNSSPLSFVVGNPAPALTSLSPNSVPATSPDTTVTINGTGFVAGAKARAGNTDLATTFISSTQLTAVVPAGLLTAPTTLNITVTNPLPGGGTSSALPFTVNLGATGLQLIASSGNQIARVNGGMVVIQVLQNQGAYPASHIQITSATLAGTGSTSISPTSAFNLSVNGTYYLLLKFPAGAAAIGTTPTLNVNYTSANAGSGTLTFVCGIVH